MTPRQRQQWINRIWADIVECTAWHSRRREPVPSPEALQYLMRVVDRIDFPARARVETYTYIHWDRKLVLELYCAITDKTVEFQFDFDGKSCQIKTTDTWLYSEIYSLRMKRKGSVEKWILWLSRKGTIWPVGVDRKQRRGSGIGRRRGYTT